MEIGLIEVDGHGGYPNYALMKLSAWHKKQNDSVEWWQGFTHYNRVYMSKIFTFTPDMDNAIQADEIIKGGTGYHNYDLLPSEIDGTYPDYSIYPDVDYAIGFLTRGCIRKCPWCVVPKKEGYIKPYRTWQEIKRKDSNDIVFMDNNVLAHPWGVSQIEDMAKNGGNLRVDFNQALDARLITPEIAELLGKLKWIKYCRTSFDTPEMLKYARHTYDLLTQAGISKWKLQCYALIQDVAEAEQRIIELDRIGYRVYGMAYRNLETGEVDRDAQRLQRWCNRKALMKTCRFADYRG